MPITDEEAGFVRAIERDSGDDATRLVYADWLEERGESDRAAYLRAEVAHYEARLVKPEPQSLFRRLLRRSPDSPIERARSTLEEVRRDLDQSWVASVARTAIENRGCEASPVRFVFQCPLTWEHLVRTDHPLVRECQTCQKQVFYCDTVPMAKAAAARGHCVAVDASVARHEGDLKADYEDSFMGLLDVSEPMA